MKKTIIGISFLVCGIATDLALVFSAMSFLPHTSAWSTTYPSKLMFLIFAGKPQFNNDEGGLGLGWFFLFGVVLVALGVFILLREYLSKEK